MFTPYTFSRGLLRPKHLGLLFRSDQEQTDYMEKVLGYSPVAYWMLSESAGPTADNAEGTADRDGTYESSGVTYSETGIGDGRTSVKLDGTAGAVDIKTTSLYSAFSGDEMSLMGWFKVTDASVWSDGLSRRGVMFYIDADNYARIGKSLTVFEAAHRAGGTSKQITKTDPGTGWFAAGYSYSKTGDYMKMYFNGNLVNTLTELGTFNKGSSFSYAWIGAQGTPTPSIFWSGWAAHVQYYNTPLGGTAMADLASIA